MCYCDCDDNPELFSEKFVTARKQYTCCECGSEIDPGEKYQRCAGKWGFGFDTFHTCVVCARVRASVLDEEPCIAFGRLYESVGIDFEEAAI